MENESGMVKNMLGALTTRLVTDLICVTSIGSIGLVTAFSTGVRIGHRLQHRDSMGGGFVLAEKSRRYKMENNGIKCSLVKRYDIKPHKSTR